MVAPLLVIVISLPCPFLKTIFSTLLVVLAEQPQTGTHMARKIVGMVEFFTYSHPNELAAQEKGALMDPAIAPPMD